MELIFFQIIPFMFIVAKTNVAQHGLKVPCVLVPTDVKKICTVFPSSCNQKYLISLALIWQLTDKSVFNKQQICPALVNAALPKLTNINPCYSNITVHNGWEDFHE